MADSNIEDSVYAAVEVLLSLTKSGRVEWKAPYGSISETLHVSTPRTTFAIVPNTLMPGMSVELYDSDGTKVVDLTVQERTPLGIKVYELYRLAHSTVFKADEVLHNLLEDLDREK